MSDRRQTARYGWSFGWACLCVVCGLAFTSSGAVSLDEFLTSLETNGVLSDRVAARDGGLLGILQSIDPEVELNGHVRPAGGLPDGARVPSPVVSVELWPENLAYLKVSGLESGSGTELLAHVKALRDCWGVLVDLRGARGEDLESACVLASLTRREGAPLFVVTDNRGGSAVTNCVIGGFTWSPLLMILIDAGTDGAAEAWASVLKGAPGVLLIGGRTRGNRKLRESLVLPDGRTAWIASRKWGLLLEDAAGFAGVRPDIDVKPGVGRSSGLDEKEHKIKSDRVASRKSEADRDLMRRIDGDAALQRATDLLLGLQALGGYGRE